jgi:hypothetical protein
MRSVGVPVRRAIARGQENEGMTPAHLSNKTAGEVDSNQTRDDDYLYDSSSSGSMTSQQHEKPNRQGGGQERQGRERKARSSPRSDTSVRHDDQ